ncbi:uncharacterized protein K452DRAFT_309785 [Aplosporella prunicola CBS 121167]|uniref:Uncharacterized protein n=1 Tax=Aplosporella prunicola CBS 121167 TaxID=1176127 RepID=A0A6A6B910_9PEZI|nr:uncharacterized protein K452DRAFT_309785 [Aplosporella prunicola CBS 121167]KAF2140669.1 hypothetical protein K452DRAFT_309785 [Aplosporella prunicola CBS 121167]
MSSNKYALVPTQGDFNNYQYRTPPQTAVILHPMTPTQGHFNYRQKTPPQTAAVLHPGAKGGMHLEHDMENQAAAFLEVAGSLHNNGASIFELIQEAFENVSTYSEEERSEIVDMARHQFNDLYKTTTTFMTEATANRLEKEKVLSIMHQKATRDQALLYMSREQQLCNTITLRDNTIMALNSTVSHMTLQIGLLRGEIEAFRADNKLLSRKADEGAKSTKALQALTTDLASKIRDLEKEKLHKNKESEAKVSMVNGMSKQFEASTKSMVNRLESEKSKSKHAEQRISELEAENKKLREIIQLKASCPPIEEPRTTDNDTSVATKINKIEPMKRKLAVLQQEIDDIVNNKTKT